MNQVRRHRPKGLATVTNEMVWVEAGSFHMGSDRHYLEERPARRVSVAGFFIDTTPVTNAQFRTFVGSTDHVTCAEIRPDPNDYPGALPEMLKAGRWSSRLPIIRLICVIGVDGGGSVSVPIGGGRTAPAVPSRDLTITRSSISRTQTPKLMRAGQASSCRPRPNGNTRLAAAWTTPNTPGR
jgi:hypothetical protein